MDGRTDGRCAILTAAATMEGCIMNCLWLKTAKRAVDGCDMLLYAHGTFLYETFSSVAHGSRHCASACMKLDSRLPDGYVQS